MDSAAEEMVTVQATVSCLGMERNDPPVTVALTPLIQGALNNGYLVLVKDDLDEALEQAERESQPRRGRGHLTS